MKTFLCGLLALVSIARAGVLENRAVGIVAAVVKGKDTLILKAYASSRPTDGWSRPCRASCPFPPPAAVFAR